jgi:hypothetical protein
MSKKQSLLLGGLKLTLRNWPALLWTYLFNFALAWLFTLPLHVQIASITANSLASERLTHGFDLGVLIDVVRKLAEGPGPAVMGSYYSMPIYFALYFLIVPGTLLCYQTGEPARLFTLLAVGLEHFWRFVRITLVTLVVFIPVLGGLDALQRLWRDHVDETVVGRPAFLMELAGLIIIALVAVFLRMYFDLVQIYTVQRGLQTHPPIPGKKTRVERQIRRTFKPAWKALWHNCFRVYLSVLVISLIGVGVLALAARTAMHSLAQPHVGWMFLLAQIGLFVMLLTRFWQRGAETILALENPLPEPVAVIPEPVAPEPHATESTAATA